MTESTRTPEQPESVITTPNDQATLSNATLTVLAQWIHDQGNEVSLAFDKPASWHTRKHHECYNDTARKYIVVSNGEFVLDLVEKIEAVAADIGCSLDQETGFEVWVEDRAHQDGERAATLADIVRKVTTEATTALKEAALLAQEREARAARKALRSGK